MDEVLFNIIVNGVTLAGYVYLASKQFVEIQRLPDSITPIRRMIFLIHTIAVITIVPIIVYQFTVYQGSPSEALRSVSTVLSPVNQLFTLALLIILVNYRIKEE